MNKIHKSAVGLAAFGSVLAMGGNVSHADQGDGSADILSEMPDSLRDQAVLDGVITCSIDSNIREQLGVIALQKEYYDLGYSRSGVDGIDGKKFCMDTLQLQDDNRLYVDGVVGNEVVWFLGGMKELLDEHGKNNEHITLPKKTNISNSETSKVKRTISDCSRYNEWSTDTIMAVQKAIGAYVDGKFKDESCDKTIKYQLENNIVSPDSPYLGYLGSKTLASLGIEPTRKSDVKSERFDPSLDCPSRYSCELIYDISDKRGYVKKNDGVWETATGETLFSFPIIPGGKSNPTNTGHFTLGPVEKGSNGNPWRLSTITASLNPFANPNLYKFRRHNPVSGGWSGEGTHGTKTFWGSSLGCARTIPQTQDVIAELPNNISLIIQN